MAKLKGIKKLNKQITKAFRKAVFADCPKMYADTDFSYWMDSEEITYGLVVTDYADKMMTTWVKDTFDFKIGNIFVFSILHELGHYFTEDDFTDEEMDADTELKETLEDGLTKLRRRSKEYNELYQSYFGLPTEYSATKWAVDWIRENRKEANKLCIECNEALAKFYLRNGVTDDDDDIYI